MILGIFLEFFEGGFIDLDKSEILVACDGEADGTDAGIKV